MKNGDLFETVMTSDIRYCPNCGKQLGGGRYCPYCAFDTEKTFGIASVPDAPASANEKETEAKTANKEEPGRWRTAAISISMAGLAVYLVMFFTVTVEFDKVMSMMGTSVGSEALSLGDVISRSGVSFATVLLIISLILALLMAASCIWGFGAAVTTFLSGIAISQLSFADGSGGGGFMSFTYKATSGSVTTMLVMAVVTAAISAASWYCMRRSLSGDCSFSFSGDARPGGRELVYNVDKDWNKNKVREREKDD